MILIWLFLFTIRCEIRLFLELLDFLLKTRVLGGNSGTCSSNSDGQVSTETNMGTRNNSKLENLGPVGRGLGSSSSHSALVKGGRGLGIGEENGLN